MDVDPDIQWPLFAAALSAAHHTWRDGYVSVTPRRDERRSPDCLKTPSTVRASAPETKSFCYDSFDRYNRWMSSRVTVMIRVNPVWLRLYAMFAAN